MFTSPTPTPPTPPPLAADADHNKKKRRPAGTPDPDAEVVSLSPRTLLESYRYVCEICNQGFQRDQNLQMHRRRHKVPWKLLKRESSAAAAGEVRKRVFVCPEPSCLHHDPSHALGDLVGIKKHFRRKHSDRKQWVCERCSKGYAVQSDYKAHLKTCGTRGHSCDCGRVFSRVESFIEHQDACNACVARPDAQAPETVSQSRTSLSSSPLTSTKLISSGARTWPDPRPLNPTDTAFLRPNLELQLLPTSIPYPTTTTANSDEAHVTQFHLSLAPGGGSNQPPSQDQLRLATAEKALADGARQKAKQQVELAEQEFANAKRIRQQAQAELDKAFVLRDHAARSINSILFQITCHACRQRLRLKPEPPNDNSLAAAASYMSSVVTEEPELV